MITWSNTLSWRRTSRYSLHLFNHGESLKDCPFCAEPIQDAAIVCKHCGRDLSTNAKTPPAKADTQHQPPEGTRRRRVAIGLLAVALLAVVGLIAQSSAKQQDPLPQPTVPRFAPAPPPPPRIIPIALASDIDINAGQIERIDWNIPSDQPNCHLTGHVEVTAGGVKDVQVFVLRADEFKNLANGHSASSYLSTDRTTVVTLDLRLATPGPMVLAISNGFSVFTGKRVQLKDVQAKCT